MSDSLQLVGPSWGGLGTFKPFTSGPSGAQRTQDAHARYTQAVLEGRVFFMDSDSVTLAAANTTKGALGTVKLINGFYNPAKSNKIAVINRVVAATVSGTPAGPLLYGALAYGGSITSAATGSIRNALTLATNGSAMTPQTGVVIAATPADTTTVLAQIGTMGGPAAIAAGAGIYSQTDEVAGLIVVPPGCLFGIVATGAGTTHVVQTSIYWEEIPYPSSILTP